MSASTLPPLFARWAADFLDGEVPGEPKATCQRCAMCAHEDTPASDGMAFYSPATVCCTYYPDLANFLVGRLLDEGAPDAIEGRRTVEERIARGVGVTPLGLARPPVYTLIYERALAAFGKAKALDCPHHLPDGRCGVWRHRESTCATWFCKHERGAVGKTFWRRMHELLAATEQALRRECVLRLDPGPRALEALFPPHGAGSPGLGPEQVDQRPDPREHALLWGRWAGREHEFFRACSAIVDAMSWQDVLAVGGSQLAVCLALTRKAHAAVLSGAVPVRARKRGLHVLGTSAQSALVATYSAIDPLQVPARLLEVLHHFDGRTTDEALHAIREQTGLRLAPGVVRKLCDFGVLADESDAG